MKSGSRFRQDGDRLVWQGEILPDQTGQELKEAIHYQVIFTLAEDGIWFWDVTVEGADVLLDVIYTQERQCLRPAYR